MFSPQAQAYLRSVERRESVDDLNVLRESLRRHGVPEKEDLRAGPGWRLVAFGKWSWQLWSTADAQMPDLAGYRD